MKNKQRINKILKQFTPDYKRDECFEIGSGVIRIATHNTDIIYSLLIIWKMDKGFERVCGVRENQRDINNTKADNFTSSGIS